MELHVLVREITCILDIQIYLVYKFVIMHQLPRHRMIVYGLVLHPFTLPKNLFLPVSSQSFYLSSAKTNNIFYSHEIVAQPQHCWHFCLEFCVVLHIARYLEASLASTQ